MNQPQEKLDKQRNRKGSLDQQFQMANIPSDLDNRSRSANSNQQINQHTFPSFNKLIQDAQGFDNVPQSATIRRLKQLEGQCKIKKWQFIKLNKCQSIIVFILLILTVIGLFAIKYSAWFRRKAFYNLCSPSQATHIFITGNQRNHDIVNILVPGSLPIFFFYKKLKYQIGQIGSSNPIPTAYVFERQFEDCFNLERLRKGLTSQEVKNKRELFGPNQHLVETPSYPQYLIHVMTEPFFLLQYFFVVMFFIQNYAPFSIALLFFSFLTTTINYIMLWISYKKIKEIAQKKIDVTVMRNGQKQIIDSKELVPGDVYIPQEPADVPADCIVGYGDVYVNEANLTGESFPIGKFKISDVEEVKNSNIWIYEGSKILETKKGNTFTVVINTGFTTHRGRIIRKIMNRTAKDPDIIRTTLIFVLEVLIVSLIAFFSTLFIILNRDIERIYVFFKLIDFLASSAPPALPILFNLAYSLSLFRLGYKGINGTQPQKSVDGAQVKTFCFDKTGTLTKSDVSISKVFKINNERGLEFNNIITQLGKSENSIFWQLFGTCHTTKLINDELLGDEIDKQMFNFINAKMQNTNDDKIRFIVKSTKQFQSKIQDDLELGKEEEDLIEVQRKRSSLIQMKNQHFLQVLRINQFQSKFQSMSVLVRDAIQGKFYVFAKGSPEKLLENSSNILKIKDGKQLYMKMIKTLSLNGLRTIAMSFKQLKTAQQIQYYLKADRQEYLKDTFTLGFIAFENKLKVDTWLTISRLIKSNIEPKMITGDNIYIAVETARRSGILSENEKVVFLEGNRNLFNSIKIEQQQGKFTRIFQGTVIQKIKQQVQQNQTSNFKEEIIQIHEKFDYLKGGYTFAVDNTFLTMDPPPLLSHNIKVFARIPPENKAFVIRQYKKQHNEYIRTHYSSFTRWLKTKKWKIGMCGDGANDLLALRQADLSIGIQATDASYGSSFTVSNMLDVDWVIKQSKNTQSNIIHLYQFYASGSMFVLICSIILLTDASYFSTPALMYLNFGTILIIPVALSMTRPSGEQSEFVPDANMMGLHNHLIFWGNLLIPYMGILGAWFYFYNTDEFEPNPKTKVTVDNGSFNSKIMSTSLIFVLVLMVLATNAFIMHRSYPWRQKIITNYPLSILLFINLLLAMIFAFLMKEVGEVMQFEPITVRNVGICVAILFGSIFLNFFYNTIVACFQLDHKKLVLEKEEAKLASLIARPGKIKIRDSLQG